MRVLVRRCPVLLRRLRDHRRTQRRVRGEHPVKADLVQPRSWHQRGQALHELLRLHDDVGGAVASRALELQHHLPPGIAAQAFVGECGAGYAPA